MLWPKRKVKEGYEAIAVATDDGKIVQGYPASSRPRREIVVREATDRRERPDRRDGDRGDRDRSAR